MTDELRDSLLEIISALGDTEDAYGHLLARSDEEHDNPLWDMYLELREILNDLE